jgi:hypothetical protein
MNSFGCQAGGQIAKAIVIRPLVIQTVSEPRKSCGGEAAVGLCEAGQLQLARHHPQGSWPEGN